MKRKRFCIILLCLLVLIVLAGTLLLRNKKPADISSSITVQEQTPSAEKEIFAMDTYMTFQAYGDRAQEAVDAAAEEIDRLDGLLSTEKAGSEINTINKNGSGMLSEDTMAIMDSAMKLYRDTEGIFDMTVYPLMQEWGFTDGNYHVPSQERIQKLSALVNSGELEYQTGKQELKLPEGVRLDFGGIAKGYASDRIMEIYERYGIKSGIVSLGGNVQFCGNKADGSAWRVAIQSPDKEEGYIGILQESDKAVITSGGYERYFEKDGKVWHHIIDPRTGYPAENELESVTIVSDEGIKADGLSTSLFIMGKDKALAYWRNHSDEFDVILLEKDGEITVTEGIEDSFTSDYPYDVVEK